MKYIQKSTCCCHCWILHMLNAKRFCYLGDYLNTGYVGFKIIFYPDFEYKRQIKNTFLSIQSSNSTGITFNSRVTN